ncbi:unnamed protein product [Vicia faba]|uniref:Cobalamin-independent methionine synthase MetE C-terminal/archaeal domain-containing protein n=1 Tax=Vicia faba TaxID=3906 RepID=A0AAV0Z7G7_VICFA|nr:unnamed protein product [Vicia faba]
MVLIDVKCDMIQVIISPHLVSKHKSTTDNQIALDIKDEVEDLEKGGIGVIQIDEATLREVLPLRKLEHAHYLDRVVHSLKTTIYQCWCSGFHSDPHSHVYSNFNDFIHSIIDMDVDVITIENSVLTKSFC